MRPTPLLPQPLAQIYTYIHTLLILFLYYMRFADLVTDPVATLLGLAGPVAVCQGVCCVICLPVGGSGNGGNGTTANQGKQGQRKGKGKGKETDGDAAADMGTRVKVRFFCPSLCPSHTSSRKPTTGLDC